MMLDDFKQIVETKAPHTVQDRLVTFEEAKAVVSNYDRLTDPYRSKFMSMPINNIIEFSLMAKPNGGFKTYVKDVETKVHQQTIVNEQRDVPDLPIEPEIKPEPVKPPPRKKPRIIERAPPPALETLFTKLIERIEKMSQPNTETLLAPLIERIENLSQPTINVETTHVERLYEVEQAMLTALNELMERNHTNEQDTRDHLVEMVNTQQAMVQQVNETQAQISQTLSEVVTVIGVLTEKVNDMAQNAPVISPIVNVPAPVVNVSMQEGRKVTKLVERDENGLISKIIEGHEAEPIS